MPCYLFLIDTAQCSVNWGLECQAPVVDASNWGCGRVFALLEVQTCVYCPELLDSAPVWSASSVYAIGLPDSSLAISVLCVLAEDEIDACMVRS